MIGDADVLALDRCVAGGGVVIFPADTVYGIGCDPSDEAAVSRLFALKGRDSGKPAAVMFFSVERLIEELGGLPDSIDQALRRLLPGPITAIVPAGDGPLATAARAGKLGVRVPKFEGDLAALGRAQCVLLQSSANLSGGSDARRLQDVPSELRGAVDLELDGGELPGVASTVVDLSDYADGGRYEILREGAVSADRVAALI